jgi:hypothetical protein
MQQVYVNLLGSFSGKYGFKLRKLLEVTNPAGIAGDAAYEDGLSLSNPGIPMGMYLQLDKNI